MTYSSAILVYSSSDSPRLIYTLNLVFKTILDIDYQLTFDKKVFRESGCPKLNYSDAELTSHEVFIPSSGLLFENNIHTKVIDFSILNGLPALFSVQWANQVVAHDSLASIFYLVSRYEEYLPYTKDEHGRFTAQQSIAYRYGFIHQPVVNQWVLEIKRMLLEKYKELKFPKQSFHFQPTYDIDLAWAYRQRNLLRTLGGFCKDLANMRLGIIKEKLDVLIGNKKDPFFVFKELDKMHNEHGLKPIYFILLGNYGKYDANISHKNFSFQQLICDLHHLYPIGIHPSYQSNFDVALLEEEINRLHQITQSSITKSRQHYLKLQLPDTYRQLIQLGIQEDYSMGYADEIGFRAGIATPFHWYDLEKEKTTPLIIHPFQVMDVTLQQYLKLSPQTAVEYVRPLIQSIRQVNGTFNILWHNSSFSTNHGWEGWEAVYEEIVLICK